MYKNGSKFMLFLMLFYLAMGFFVLPLALIGMGLGEEEISILFRSPYFFIAQQLLLLLMPLLIWMFANRISFKNFLKFEPLELINVIIIVGIALLMQPGMMFVGGLVGLFSPNIIAEAVTGIMDYPFWLVVVTIAVTPSIVEELVFRGYIQNQYEGLGIKKAAIISGLFFGIIHMNMQQFFYAFLAGVVFAYIVYYTKSIIAGMLAHFVLNGSQLLMLRMALLAESRHEELVLAYEAAPLPEIEPIFAVIAIGVLALFTTPPAIYLLHTLVRRCKLRHEFAEPETNETNSQSPMVYDRPLTEPVAEEPEHQSPVVYDRPFADPFLIAVVIIFVAFIIYWRINIG